MIIAGLVLTMIGLALWVWAIAEAARTPAVVWREAGQNKVVWLGVIVVLGLLGTFAYVAVARPMLARARAASPGAP